MIEIVKTVIGCYFLLPDFSSHGHPSYGPYPRIQGLDKKHYADCSKALLSKNMTIQNGAKYEGQYKFNKKNGNGSFYYPDGSVYHGQWLHDQKNGIGTYIYRNGDEYKGNWEKDLKHGHGTYSYR